MIKSMTAYGRAENSVNGKNILIELKSVNSRFLDLTVRTPRGYAFLEEKIKNRISEKGVSRGKVEVLVSINAFESSDSEIIVNKEYTDRYIKALKELGEMYELRDDTSILSVSRNPDVFSIVSKSMDIDKEWEDIKPVVDSAIDAFNIAREKEGANLVADLAKKKDRLMLLASQASEKQGDSVAKYQERLYTKMLQVFAENDINVAPGDQRIITEVAIFADKVAIDEELVRLNSHFSSYDETMSSGGPVGKRLDFLLQEMNREVNSMGSKVSDSSITAIVVDMKCELEKIREQIQNLE